MKRENKNLKTIAQNKKRNRTARKKRRNVYVWLNIQPQDTWLRVRQGNTVRNALRDNNIKVDGDCGGLGKCGKCKVKVLSAPDAPTEDEVELLTESELDEGIRLACCTKMKHDLVISMGIPSAEEEYFQILTTSHVITDRYIPISQLNPLVNKKLVALSSDIKKEGISNLDKVRLAMGSEYGELSASLPCLRTLPQKVADNHTYKTAVLHEQSLLALQELDDLHHHYGIVLDIGTSTLVGKLINLVDGTEMAVASCLNSQSRFGSDIISRLEYVRKQRRGLQILQYFLTRDLKNLISHLVKTAGLESKNIFIVIAAGNTTMQHVLLGLSPVGIGEVPFSPVLTDAIVVKAADTGLNLHPESLCYVMPAKSGYIGGDLISFILVSGVLEHDEIVLGLDIGTNGEIFLGNRRRLLTCSAAAGPAFEGGRISHGMIAKAGAIEGARIKDDHINLKVIGNIKPRGICGSGLLDLVSVLLHCGIIDYEGLIRSRSRKVSRELNSRIIAQSTGNMYLVSSLKEGYKRQPIYLTQKDIREVQLAKGAIAAGIHILMNELGIKARDIDYVYLAGALGNYVNPLSAVRTGLLPKMKPEAISSLGNAASMGASMALLSREHWQMAKDYSAFIEHVELSSLPDFNKNFIEQLDFPKKNIW
jgi:uncharacterized 2Fe-2S/4Fe-4S cluster protein (DUF4445 family)